jgi:2'-5' RNA ligase
VARLFCGVALPPRVRTDLASWCRAVGLDAAAWRPVHPETLHWTVRFFGEVAPARRPDLEGALAQAAARTPPFALSAGALSGLPSPRQARVAVLVPDQGGDGLAALVRAVEACLGAVGVAREDRPYRAHLTVARCRDGVAPVPAARARLTQTVDALTLWESVLARPHALHRPLAQWRLEGPRPDPPIA